MACEKLQGQPYFSLPHHGCSIQNDPSGSNLAHMTGRRASLNLTTFSGFKYFQGLENQQETERDIIFHLLMVSQSKSGTDTFSSLITSNRK